MSKQKPIHEVEEIEGIEGIVRTQDCVRSGEEYQNIFSALKGPKNVVVSIILKWKKFGTTKTLPRTSRLAKLNNQGRRAWVREGTKNRMVTLTELWRSSVEMGEPSRSGSGFERSL